MKIYNKEEVNNILSSPDKMSFEYDNHGQVVIYTGIYKWNDETWRDEPEPELD